MTDQNEEFKIIFQRLLSQYQLAPDEAEALLNRILDCIDEQIKKEGAIT